MRRFYPQCAKGVEVTYRLNVPCAGGRGAGACSRFATSHTPSWSRSSSSPHPRRCNPSPPLCSTGVGGRELGKIAWGWGGDGWSWSASIFRIPRPFARRNIGGPFHFFISPFHSKCGNGSIIWSKSGGASIWKSFFKPFYLEFKSTTIQGEIVNQLNFYDFSRFVCSPEVPGPPPARPNEQR